MNKKKIYVTKVDEEIPLLSDYKEILIKKHMKAHEKKLMQEEGLAEADKTHLKTFHMILRYPALIKGVNKKMMKIIIFSIFEDQWSEAEKEALMNKFYQEHLAEVTGKRN